MKKHFNYLFALLLLLALLLVFIGCSDHSNGEKEDDEKDDPIGDLDETFKTKEEVVKALTNYSFKYTYTYYDGEETQVLDIVDIKNNEAWLYEYDDLIILANKTTKSSYMLNKEDKTGMIIDLTDDYESFSSWGTHLFSWYDNVDGFKKIKTEKILNRDCNVYEYSFGTIKYTYYIDREYDLCLKFDFTESLTNSKSSFVFTEFKIGGIKTTDITAILEDYEIDDYRTGE